MSKTKVVLMMTALIAAIIVELPQPAGAQISWLRPEKDKTVTLQMLHVALNGDSYIAFPSSLLFLSGRFPMGENLHFVAEFPMSYVNYDHDYFDWYSQRKISSQTLLGNPYLGVETSKPGSTAIFKLGGRIPIASKEKDDAAALGVLGAFDRAEGFGPDIFSATMQAGYRYDSESGYTLKGLIGPTLLVSTASGQDHSSEVWADYQGEVRLHGSRLTAGIGLTGRYLLSAEHVGDMTFGERIVNQVGFAMTVDAGRIEPGVHVQVPLDEDLNDAVQVVYGLVLTVKLD